MKTILTNLPKFNAQEEEDAVEANADALVDATNAVVVMVDMVDMVDMVEIEVTVAVAAAAAANQNAAAADHKDNAANAAHAAERYTVAVKVLCSQIKINNIYPINNKIHNKIRTIIHLHLHLLVIKYISS